MPHTTTFIAKANLQWLSLERLLQFNKTHNQQVQSLHKGSAFHLTCFIVKSKLLQNTSRLLLDRAVSMKPDNILLCNKELSIMTLRLNQKEKPRANTSTQKILMLIFRADRTHIKTLTIYLWNRKR